MRQVLRHQIHLAGALHFEQLRFADQVIERERPMLAAHERNGTERTPVVAPLGDLEVAHMRQVAAEQAHAGMLHQRSAQQATRHEFRNQAVGLGSAQKYVDLGQRLLELRLVPLHHATDGKHRLTRAVVLQSCGGHDRFDRFRLGRIDEAAGIHHHHIGITQVGDLLTPMGDEIGEIPFGVYRVLITPEGDQSELEHA